MIDLMLKMYINAKNFVEREEGQDLVEYALVVAIVALGAIAGMGALAKEINAAFNTISSTLATALN